MKQIKTLFYILIFCFIISNINIQANEISIDKEYSKLKKIYFKEGLIDKLNKRSLFYREISPEKSYLYATKALSLSLNSEYEKGKAESYLNIGIASVIKSNLKEALESLQMAKLLYHTIDDSKGLANTFTALGRVSEFRGKYKDALLNHNKALDLYLAIQDSLGIGRALNNIGLTYDLLEDQTTSIQFLLKSLRIKESINDTLAIKTTKINIGNVYYSIGNYNLSLKYYKEALIIINSQIDLNESDLFGVENNIALVYLQLDSLTYAKYYFYHVLKIAKQHNSAIEIALTYYNLGTLNLKIANNYLAKQYFSQSLEIYKKLDDNELIADNYISLAYHEIKLTNTDEAIELMSQSVKLLKKNDSFTKLSKLYLSLADVYFAKGDYFKSDYYRRQYSAIFDSLNKIQKDNSFALITDKVLAEKEIELMDKDVMLVKAENQKIIYSGIFGAMLFLSILIFSIVLYRKNSILKKRNFELKRMYQFKEDAYIKLTDDISNVLNVLALSITKLSYTPEYKEISNLYSEFAEYYNNLVNSFKQKEVFINN